MSSNFLNIELYTNNLRSCHQKLILMFAYCNLCHRQDKIHHLRAITPDKGRKLISGLWPICRSCLVNQFCHLKILSIYYSFHVTRGSEKPVSITMSMCIINHGQTPTVCTRREFITKISFWLISSCWSFFYVYNFHLYSFDFV